jgi:hypothetical protein
MQLAGSVVAGFGQSNRPERSEQDANSKNAKYSGDQILFHSYSVSDMFGICQENILYISILPAKTERKGNQQEIYDVVIRTRVIYNNTHDRRTGISTML